MKLVLYAHNTKIKRHIEIGQAHFKFGDLKERNDKKSTKSSTGGGNNGGSAGAAMSLEYSGSASEELKGSSDLLLFGNNGLQFRLFDIEIKKKETFLSYLLGGVEMDLNIAIDLTSAKSDILLNDKIVNSVISSIASILEDYGGSVEDQ